jgi:hypothetical protein
LSNVVVVYVCYFEEPGLYEPIRFIKVVDCKEKAEQWVKAQGKYPHPDYEEVEMEYCTDD